MSTSWTSTRTNRFLKAWDSVLLASGREEDQRVLSALAGQTPWRFIRVGRWQEALRVMGTVIMPVMICDRNLPDLTWPNGLADLRRIFRFPSLVILADADDVTVVHAAEHFGAFHVLARPVSHSGLITILEAAWTEWRTRYS